MNPGPLSEILEQSGSVDLSQPCSYLYIGFLEENAEWTWVAVFHLVLRIKNHVITRIVQHQLMQCIVGCTVIKHASDHRKACQVDQASRACNCARLFLEQTLPVNHQNLGGRCFCTHLTRIAEISLVPLHVRIRLTHGMVGGCASAENGHDHSSEKEEW